MSYAIRFENRLDLYCGNMTMAGLDNEGNTIAPIITTSNVACSNLNAEIWGGKYINESLTVGDILVCSNALTQTFVRLPIGANAEVLTVNDAMPLGLAWM